MKTSAKSNQRHRVPKKTAQSVIQEQVSVSDRLVHTQNGFLIWYIWSVHSIQRALHDLRPSKTFYSLDSLDAKSGRKSTSSWQNSQVRSSTFEAKPTSQCNRPIFQRDTFKRSGIRYATSQHHPANFSKKQACSKSATQLSHKDHQKAIAKSLSCALHLFLCQ